MALFRIFGAGEWGLAVANHLSIQNNLVEIYLRDIDKVDSYKTNKIHKNLDIKFGKNISFFNLNKVSEISNDINIINIIATSSSGFLNIITDNIDYFKKTQSLTWLTKGLDHTSGSFFHQILDDLLPDKIDKCIISGPSFAIDLVNKINIKVSIASTDDHLTEVLINAMNTDNFTLLQTRDFIGVEVSGVLKNISAILAGSLTVNEFPDEYVHELISISQQEVYRISKLIMANSRGYEVSDSEMKKTLNSPACLGDLELTCFYNTSRNRQLGLKLSRDCNIKKLLSNIGTVEGYLSTGTLSKNKVIYSESKIIKSAYDILYNHIEPRRILEGLYN
jgi:glycerol-3-phosphate dehydrogenase (NAD(P)+)